MRHPTLTPPHLPGRVVGFPIALPVPGSDSVSVAVGTNPLPHLGSCHIYWAFILWITPHGPSPRAPFITASPTTKGYPTRVWLPRLRSHTQVLLMCLLLGSFQFPTPLHCIRLALAGSTRLDLTTAWIPTHAGSPLGSPPRPSGGWLIPRTVLMLSSSSGGWTPSLLPCPSFPGPCQIVAFPL